MDALIAELRLAIERYDCRSDCATATSAVVNCARDVVAAWNRRG